MYTGPASAAFFARLVAWLNSRLLICVVIAPPCRYISTIVRCVSGLQPPDQPRPACCNPRTADDLRLRAALRAITSRRMANDESERLAVDAGGDPRTTA